MEAALFVIEILIPVTVATGICFGIYNVRRADHLLYFIGGFGFLLPLVCIVVIGVWWGILATPVIVICIAVLVENIGLRLIAREKAQALADARVGVQNKISQLEQRASVPFPDVSSFDNILQSSIHANFAKKSVDDQVTQKVINEYSALLRSVWPQPLVVPPKPLYFDVTNEHVVKALIDVFEKLAIERELFTPNLLLEALTESADRLSSYVPRSAQSSFTAKVQDACDVRQAMTDMVMPFYKTGDIEARKMAEPIRAQWRAGGGVARDRTKGAAQVWPKDYKGDDVLSLYLLPPMRRLFDVEVPFVPFTDEQRCAHHWCLGKTGRGKTTFLSHLIKDDLSRVATGECSLVIVDSKDLIRKLRTLKMFDASGSLDGCLTIIDSDDVFPLNPFYLPETQAKAVVSYMLAALSDASDLQTGALNFYINAALKTPNPTLYTIRDLMALDAKKGELPKDISRFDKDTQHWFINTRKTLHQATSAGISQRLSNFLDQHKRLAAMFNAGSWGLDLDELHKGGRVWLIDTDLNTNGQDGTALLGRLIIALMEQLATKRNAMDERSLKPVWFYLDEASDYISNDDKFVQILTKARSSRVGTTVAYQYRGMVDARIEKALENVAIHSECKERGRVELMVEEKPSSLAVEALEFDREPQMTRDDYQKLREWLRFRYPHEQARRSDGGQQPLTQKF